LHEGISDPEYRQSIQAELERLIATGSAAAFAHFTLGSILWPYGEPQKALFHVERSLELDPQFTDAANNLAWILASQETPDLERAEGLIRQAIAKKASDVRYQDTLALILAGKGQWKETLAILEKILPYVPGSALRDTHLRLAEAYDEIGDKNLASLHRELADGPKR
jgi:tetratricopeptide (TPR) repeat protein